MVGLILLKCTILLKLLNKYLRKSKFQNLLSKHFFCMNMYTFSVSIETERKSLSKKLLIKLSDFKCYQGYSYLICQRGWGLTCEENNSIIH